VDAESVTVAQEGTMEMAGGGGGDKSNPMAAMLASMKAKSSSVKGTLKISRKDGLALAADTEMTMEMTMGGDEGSMPGMPAGGIEMTMKLTTHQERKAAPAEGEKKPAEKPAEKPKDAQGGGDKK
jgi:hypothetical protein